MSLYAVKNDEGEWWDFGYLNFWPKDACSWSATSNHKDAKFAAANHGGHVVELVEAPEKVVVSEEEAEMLKRAKAAAFPAHIFDSGAAGSLPGSQDRLMRAYVIGWTVEKPKRWNVKVPHTDDSFYYKIDDEFCNAALSTAVWLADEAKFTDAEIEQYDLTRCERVVVADDEQ